MSLSGHRHRMCQERNNGASKLKCCNCQEQLPSVCRGCNCTNQGVATQKAALRTKFPSGQELPSKSATPGRPYAAAVGPYTGASKTKSGAANVGPLYPSERRHQVRRKQESHCTSKSDKNFRICKDYTEKQ
jgi:hypothetical protein